MSEAPTLEVVSVRFAERPVRLRLPFRFGAMTLTEAQQAFVRVGIRLEDGRESVGYAADFLAPKWFDKNPELTNEENADQLRTSLALVRALYLETDRPLTAFGLHAAHQSDQYAQCDRRGLNGLIAGFGSAMIDRAVLDALGKCLKQSIFQIMQSNRAGIDSTTAPDLEGFDLDSFCASLNPAEGIAVRHTVGLADPITETDIDPANRIGDGLPESLEAVIRTYANRYFKIKVAGDRAADIDRLSRIASVLDRRDDEYFVTLDGNEQYPDGTAVVELMRAIGKAPRLRRLAASVLYVEQPTPRTTSLSQPIHDLASISPVAIDEADTDIDAFPRARTLGYRGISSKSCKGFYRSLLNFARVSAWNAEAPDASFFITAEDLTTLAGISIQQDLALATLVGCTHAERNGHHYVDGMAGASADEQQGFLAAHPGLYRRSDGRVRLVISNGRLDLRSLAAPGLGGGPEPDWSAMAERTYDL